MTDENNQIKFFLYENWARTKTGQHTVPNVAEKSLRKHLVQFRCHTQTLSEEL